MTSNKENNHQPVTKADYLVIGISAAIAILAKIALHFDFLYLRSDTTIVGWFLAIMIFATGVCALRLMQVIKDL